MIRCLAVLRESGSAACLDNPKAFGPVGTLSRQEYPDRSFLLVFSQGTKEAVDGIAPDGLASGGRKVENPALYKHRAVGRDDVYPIGQGFVSALDFADRKPGVARQDIRQITFMFGR